MSDIQKQTNTEKYNKIKPLPFTYSFKFRWKESVTQSADASSMGMRGGGWLGKSCERAVGVCTLLSFFFKKNRKLFLFPFSTLKRSQNPKRLFTKSSAC